LPSQSQRKTKPKEEVAEIEDEIRRIKQQNVDLKKKMKGLRKTYNKTQIEIAALQNAVRHSESIRAKLVNPPPLSRREKNRHFI
jgi:chromosome segregation ATPase